MELYKNTEDEIILQLHKLRSHFHKYEEVKVIRRYLAQFHLSIENLLAIQFHVDVFIENNLMKI